MARGLTAVTRETCLAAPAMARFACTSRGASSSRSAMARRSSASMISSVRPFRRPLACRRRPGRRRAPATSATTPLAAAVILDRKRVDRGFRSCSIFCSRQMPTISRPTMARKARRADAASTSATQPSQGAPRKGRRSAARPRARARAGRAPTRTDSRMAEPRGAAPLAASVRGCRRPPRWLREAPRSRPTSPPMTSDRRGGRRAACGSCQAIPDAGIRAPGRGGFGAACARAARRIRSKTRRTKARKTQGARRHGALENGLRVSPAVRRERSPPPFRRRRSRRPTRSPASGVPATAFKISRPSADAWSRGSPERRREPRSRPALPRPRCAAPRGSREGAATRRAGRGRCGGCGPPSSPRRERARRAGRTGATRACCGRFGTPAAPCRAPLRVRRGPPARHRSAASTSTRTICRSMRWK